MQITLDKKSWHFKYYSWCLGTYTAPKSLCPYFWSLFFLIILSPLVFMLKTLFSVTDKLETIKYEKTKKKNEEIKKKVVNWEKYYEEKLEMLEKRNRFMEKAGKIFFIVIVTSIVLFALGSCIYAVMQHGWKHFLVTLTVAVGVALVVVGIIAFVAHFFPKMIDWISRRSFLKMIKGMIVSYYEKACPLINWEGDPFEERLNMKN